MNIDWMMVKEKAQAIFAKLSQVLAFQLACLYLLACTVAVKPLGPKAYVSFVYHCFQWQAQGQVRALPTPGAVGKK